MDALTLPEYSILIHAMQLREVDRNYRDHLQAFLNFSVQAKKRAGKGKERPVYARFNKFFDYEKELNKVEQKRKQKPRFTGIGKFLRKGEE